MTIWQYTESPLEILFCYSTLYDNDNLEFSIFPGTARVGYNAKQIDLDIKIVKIEEAFV